MTNLIRNIKEMLLDIIKSMAKYSWLFIKNPEKDFTRKHKLDFETMMLLLLSMDGNSIYKGLLNYSALSPNVATSTFISSFL